MPHPQSPPYHLSKSLADEPSPRFPVPRTEPLWKEMPVSRAFFYISYRDPSRGALPPGSLNRASTERDPPHLEPLSTIPQIPQSRSPLQVAQLGPHEEEAHSQSLPFKTLRAPD